MCGICGFTGKVHDAEVIIRRMTGAIVHRGPDDEGYYIDTKTALGMRRLSIIDVITGKQPIYNEDRTIWTVFNGEIYNFQEIRKELEASGHHFYTDHSDTEVIVHLYEEYGPRFVQKLNGMFAFAIWDTSQEKLILVRDRMGVKPLFYTLNGEHLIFASEIKAILASSLYTRDVNLEALYHYFSFKNIPAPFTAFKNIWSLLPGEILVLTNGKLTRERWWKIRFDERGYIDSSQIGKELFTILEDATRIRMHCDVPFGAYLSGGVDSSFIVALMTRFSDKPVKTFSLGYEDELQNKEADLYYARKVSKAYGTEHYEYIMSYRELVDEIVNVLRAFDQPFSGTISTFFLTKLIKQHVKVALSGDGADELFGSYLSHRTAQPMHYYASLREKVQSGTLTEEEKALFAPCDMEFLESLYAKSGGKDRDWRYHLYLFTDEEKDILLSDYFKNSTAGVRTYPLIAQHFEELTSRDPLNRILEMEWNTQLPDQVLAFVDFLSMAHSVEIRSPFLDYRLVESVAAIPGCLKIRKGNVKDILKKIVEPVLPKGITKRPKEGFVLPIFDWMIDRLKGYSIDVLSEKRLKQHNYFNPDVVHDIVQKYHAGNRSYAGKVWNLMMFQVWWEQYFG